MKAKLPLIVIGYDKHRLLATTNNDGVAMIPVFFDADRAERYRRHFNDNFQLKLQTFVVVGAMEALNLFEVVSISHADVTNVIFDPPTPDERESKAPSENIMDWIQSLHRLYSRHQKSRPRKKGKKGQKPHFPRSRKDRPGG